MVISGTEIKKNIISSILDFSVNIDSHKKSGQYSSIQITEMLSLAIDINNLINILDKDPSKISSQIKRPELSLADLRKLKRVLELVFRYNSDINSVAIDIGENLSSTNRFLQKGIDYILNNINKSDSLFIENQDQDLQKSSQKPQSQQRQAKPGLNKTIKKPNQPAVGIFSGFLFLLVLVAISLFIYNTFFNQHATKVTSLVKEYRSDRKLSSVTRPDSSNTLSVYGTKSILNIAIDLKSEFKARYPKIDLKIEGDDSGIAIRELIDGKIDIAAVSRIPTIEERKRAAKLGRTLADHKIALDSVVFFTHPSNSEEVISIEELKKIYKASNISWKKAILTSDITSNIDRFSLSRESGTFTYFKERVMYGEDTSDNIIHIYTPGQILDMVASNPNALGFCSLTVLKNKSFPSRTKVKILKIASIFDENGTKPISDDLSLDLGMVRKGEYPLTRYVYLITAGNLTDAQAKFIDFMRSEDAQAKLGEYGLVGVN
jgi:phosphate transport system substrate-binding protein